MRCSRWGALGGVVVVLAAGCSGSPDHETPTEVGEITVTVDDPVLGPLTFEALAAGSPEAAGDGRLVLLLHGFPETGESYRQMLPALAARGYYAVAPDQRGYSPQARPTDVESYAITHLVDDTLGLATELGAPRFQLVGHDWGGGVAWVTAALHPDRVTTLSMLSTPHPDALATAFATPGDEQAAMSSYTSAFRQPGSEAMFLGEGADSFVDVFSASGLPRAKAEAYADVLATEDALRAAMNWYRANPIPPTVRLGPITVPTLYAWGADDFALGRTAAEATSSHVDAPYRFEVLEGQGHWLPETAATELLPLILDQLDTTN